MSELRIEGIDKRFDGKVVLDGISFLAPRGEILALLGPSGSGKTTLLRIVAGFESADAGALRWGDERIDRLPPEKRDFGMVFQHYALFPHMTVGENVAFGLEARKVPRREIPERVAAALARVDLVGYERRRVGEISGGQQQRVALARALAPEPRVLLLDEPLSNLDPTLRERTRRELAETLRRIGITTLLVTHEQDEAFDLGDRVALLHQGRLDQIGTARDLYRRPATRFVAGFIGRASFVTVEIESTGGADGEIVVSGGALAPGNRLALPAAALPAAAGDGFRAGERAALWLRPEMLELVEDPGRPPLLTGTVRAVRFGGAASFASVALANGEEVELQHAGELPAAGQAIALALAPGARPRLFPSGAREGER
ncbi:MAG: ABC transporter ATP-binding protein [Thermoanaerobaculia bacterium]